MSAPIIALGMNAGELAQAAAALFGAFVGPYLAIVITQRIDRSRRNRESKIHLLKQLLSTQVSIGDPAFSAAVNLARVEFADCQPVIDALDKFVRGSEPDPSGRLATEEENELIMARLYFVIEEMSRELGFSINGQSIRRQLYAAGSMRYREKIQAEALLAWPRIATALEQQVAMVNEVRSESSPKNGKEG